MTNDKEYSNAWAELASRKQPSKLVDFPAFDENGKPVCQVIITTLTHDDHVSIQKQATFECDRSFKDDKLDRNSEIYIKRYENIVAKHFLFRACKDPENPTKSFFPTTDHVGQYLSNDEVAVLLKHYQTLQANRGPLIAYMTHNQFEEWVEKLATEAEEGPYFLDRILPEAQIQLMLYMAGQLWNSQMAKSSLGSPPEESTVEPKLESIVPPHNPEPVVPPKKESSKKK